MTFARTLYRHPEPGEPLDATAIFAATLEALDAAPHRYGDDVPIRAQYTRRAAQPVEPATECDDDADGLPVVLPVTMREASSQDATVVDWSEEMAAEQAEERDRAERSDKRRCG